MLGWVHLYAPALSWSENLVVLLVCFNLRMTMKSCEGWLYPDLICYILLYIYMTKIRHISFQMMQSVGIYWGENSHYSNYNNLSFLMVKCTCDSVCTKRSCAGNSWQPTDQLIHTHTRIACTAHLSVLGLKFSQSLIFCWASNNLGGQLLWKLSEL